MRSLRVLVVDDEPAIRQVLKSQLERLGHVVEEQGDGESALSALQCGDYDVCICDMRLPGIDGVEVLRQARGAGIETAFLMITAFASLTNAIEAMKLGAFDYLMKPLRAEDVAHRLRHIADLDNLRSENRRLRKIVDAGESAVAASLAPAMKQVEDLAAKVSRTDGTVLITGESGTGKSYLARDIHRRGPRRDKPFIQVNCGAVPEQLLESEFFGHMKGAFTGADRAKKGLFHEADGGTLFLDEIGELPMALQVKLLHAIEEKEIRPVGSQVSRRVNVRIIAATNRDVEAAVAKGRFREDLYYRLNVLQIHLPSLKDRVEDLADLLHYFVGTEAARLGLETAFSLDPAAEETLIRYAWPGNMREMQNVIARALVLAEDGIIHLSDLPDQVCRGEALIANSNPGEASAGIGNLREQVRTFERSVIKDAIRQSGGDRQEAAKRLGIGLSTLYRKIEDMEV
ncbi:MAG: sigma-54-dependent Fis family transcriptional regulator [Gammaproteobacteria bacterium]|nr:sigma-54-dependent Fis family transcriptional regulator [Gammaproteobacteria bacterium]